MRRYSGKTEYIQKIKQIKDDEIIIRILSFFSPRERFVITYRYGFFYNEILTLDEIGKNFGVTRQGIEIILRKCESKLRHSSKIRGLIKNYNHVMN